MDIRDDYKTHLSDVLAKVKKRESGDTLQFIFYTDPHHSAGGNQLYATKVIKELAGEIRLDFVVCGGDMSVNGVRQDALNAQKELMRALTVHTCPLLPVKGNHDDNSIHDYRHNTGSVQNVIFPHETYDLCFRQLEGKVETDKDNRFGMYYLYDVPDKKTRIVVLNCIDIPYAVTDEGGLLYNGQWQYAFSDRQLQWVAHEALHLKEKPDTDGWKVMVFSHIAIRQEDVRGTDHRITNDEVMWGILKAFNNGTAYKAEQKTGDFTYSVDVDFSDRGPGGLAACWFGHVHVDQSLNKDGITMISTLNASTYQEYEDTPIRISGTISETAFDIVTADFAQNLLFAARFGAGTDRLIELK